ncbi:MFS transporter, partial [Beijerinckia sp. L45]|uniref:MFS transporter n=1 Tax=Beijerinckia sp. L45 TaxID=1641855 RepID=UPI001FF03006
LSFIGIAGAIGWLLTAKKPIIDLDVFKDKNFSMGCILMGAMGGVLYASAVIIPQLAQQVLGYTATLSGYILSPGGVVVIVLIPFVGQLMKVIQTRIIVAFGFFSMGCALLYSCGLVPDIDFKTLVLMRSTQSASLAFLFVPISTIAYLTLPQSLRSDGAALFSMFRNVAGAVGISASTALVTQRSQANQQTLSQWMTPFHQPYNTLVAQTEAGLRTIGHGGANLHDVAVGQVYQTYIKQSQILAYSNVFFYFAILAFCVVPFCFLISAKKATGGGGGGH